MQWITGIIVLLIGLSIPYRTAPQASNFEIARKQFKVYSLYQKDSVRKAEEVLFITQAEIADTSAPKIRYMGTDVVIDASATIDYTVPIIEQLANKTVMVIGESNVNAGFTQYFGAFVKQSGAKYKSYSSVGISIITWCRSNRLKQLITEHKPDVVIFMVGGNDVFTPYPKYIVPDIECMLQSVKNIPFYWIMPPNLRWYEKQFGKNTPLIPVIEEVVGTARSFRADTLSLQMAGDQKHTHIKGGKKLAELFFMWFKNKYESTSQDTIHTRSDSILSK
jgi:hypothetical protein